MIKPVLGLAATGVAAVLLFKLLTVFLLPLFGIAIAFVVIAIKVVFWIAVACFAWWLVKKFLGSEPRTV
jgi:hypothetical protein